MDEYCDTVLEHQMSLCTNELRKERGTTRLRSAWDSLARLLLYSALTLNEKIEGRSVAGLNLLQIQYERMV